ncbi:MAG: MBL fold metallo-hydrolase [Gammaproteobacteria bacterium]|nr:MBL fold metallo-hydrolase [Gammaproteobacteria bacterium]
MSKVLTTVLGGALIAAAWFAGAQPDDRFASVEIKATHVAGAVHMLEGTGGNIGVSVGPDGVLIVDDQFAPLAGRISAAIESLGGGAPAYVLNTHYHGDHTGGNPIFGATGVVVAHENVRVRLVAGDMAPAGLPVVTFDDRIRLYFNGDRIDVIHLPRGHTDGDSVVWFRNAGVIHMGDHLFHGRFPYVDVPSGGSVDGFLANLETVLEMIPADTRVIPGHGPLAGVDALKESVSVIRESQAMVREAVVNGTIDALERDGFGRWEEWGSGFISTERWISIVRESDAAGNAP